MSAIRRVSRRARRRRLSRPMNCASGGVPTSSNTTSIRERSAARWPGGTPLRVRRDRRPGASFGPPSAVGRARLVGVAGVARRRLAPRQSAAAGVPRNVGSKRGPTDVRCVGAARAADIGRQPRADIGHGGVRRIGRQHGRATTARQASRRPTPLEPDAPVERRLRRPAGIIAHRLVSEHRGPIFAALLTVSRRHRSRPARHGERPDPCDAPEAQRQSGNGRDDARPH